MRNFAAVSVMAASLMCCENRLEIHKDPDYVPVAKRAEPQRQVGQQPPNPKNTVSKKAEKPKSPADLTVEDIRNGIRNTKKFSVLLIPVVAYEVKGTYTSFKLEKRNATRINGVGLTSLGKLSVDTGEGVQPSEFIGIEYAGETVKIPIEPRVFIKVATPDGEEKIKLFMPVSAPAGHDDAVWVKEYPSGSRNSLEKELKRDEDADFLFLTF